MKFQSIPMVRFYLTCMLLTGIGLFTSLKADDVPVEPPQPADGNGADVEVLTRGPVHEAFATQVNHDPQAGLIVDQSPPEPVDEIPPDYKPDGDNIVWIPGYWSYDDERKDFIWISGVWRTPPAGRRWVPGYWNELKNDRDFQWVSGFWSSSERRRMDYEAAPPQSLENGPSVSAPSSSHFWVPGVWVYRSMNYRWRPGHWVRYRPDYMYIPSRWMWTPGGYVFIDGYWDYQMSARGVMFAPAMIRSPLVRYRPSVVIDLGRFHMHWFVRPRYGHYYFGDYYDAGYHHHIYPHHHFHLNVGYDPFYAYNHVHYRHYHGISYYHHSNTWHNYFSSHPLHRPAHTFGLHLSIGSRRGDRYFGMSMYAQQLDRYRVQDDLHRRFVRVGTQYRDASQNQSASYVRLAYERNRMESAKLSASTAKGGTWTLPHVQRGENVTIASAQRNVRITSPTVRTSVTPPKAAPGTSNRVVSRSPAQLPVTPGATRPSTALPLDSGRSPRVTIGGGINGRSASLPTRPTQSTKPRPTTPSTPRPSVAPRPTTPSTPRPSVAPRPTTPSTPRPSVAPRPTTPSTPRPSVAPRPTTPSTPRPSVAPRPATPRPSPKIPTRPSTPAPRPK